MVAYLEELRGREGIRQGNNMSSEFAGDDGVNKGAADDNGNIDDVLRYEAAVDEATKTLSQPQNNPSTTSARMWPPSINAANNDAASDEARIRSFGLTRRSRFSSENVKKEKHCDIIYTEGIYVGERFLLRGLRWRPVGFHRWL